MILPFRMALWGAMGAGKTWLIYSLARELDYLSGLDKKYIYTLSDSNDQPVFVNRNQFPNPTEEMEDFLYFFRRIEKSEPYNLVVDHQIELHDNQGLNLVDAVNLSTGNPQAELTISNSAAVIALFDCRYKDWGKSHPDTGILATDSDYAEHAYNLCRLVSQQIGEKKYLAACISKIDLFPKLMQSQKDAFRILFPETLRVLESYRQKIIIEYFSVSSMGFLESKDGLVANFDPETSSLKNSERWLPFNVVTPFFWLFEEYEMKNNYISPKYPKLRPYPRASKFF